MFKYTYKFKSYECESERTIVAVCPQSIRNVEPNIYTRRYVARSVRRLSFGYMHTEWCHWFSDSWLLQRSIRVYVTIILHIQSRDTVWPRHHQYRRRGLWIQPYLVPGTIVLMTYHPIMYRTYRYWIRPTKLVRLISLVRSKPAFQGPRYTGPNNRPIEKNHLSKFSWSQVIQGLYLLCTECLRKCPNNRLRISSRT